MVVIAGTFGGGVVAIEIGRTTHRELPVHMYGCIARRLESDRMIRHPYTVRFTNCRLISLLWTASPPLIVPVSLVLVQILVI